MIRNKTMAIGAATGALFVAGCGNELGSSIVVPPGECLPMSTDIQLAVGKRFDMGGDMRINSQGINNNEIDYLRVKNLGGNILQLRQVSDGGTLVSGPSYRWPLPTSKTGISLPITPGPDGIKISFKYIEDKYSAIVSATPLAREVISLHIDASCSS
jgi:hypothetical protein